LKIGKGKFTVTTLRPELSVNRRKKDTFYFKYFRVKHDRCAHKVGTDGVLLGAWTDVNYANRILDVGTGTGVIALMLAQRTPPAAQIDAIDVSEEDSEQAAENFKASPWSTKLKALHTSLQDYQAEPYDLIVSNPPFFIDSAKPPEAGRIRARHTESLTLNELILNSIRLLNNTGRMCVILPATEGKHFISIASSHHLYCTRICEFYAREHKPLERLIMEFRFQKNELVLEKLILYQENEIWTDDYKKLTRDFYLKS
jgi:tRNA1Val (adenine37-N6)-methyltransferase